MSNKLKATDLHGEETASGGPKPPKEKFGLRISLLNPRVTRSQVPKTLEKKKPDTDEEDDDAEVVADPTASALRGLDAARESLLLVNDQIQRGRSREKALRVELEAAQEEVADLKAQLICVTADRDVLRLHRDQTVTAQKMREVTPAPITSTTTAGVPPAEMVALRDMVEGLVISKTAESLRRRAAQHLTLGVAVREAVMGTVAKDAGCVRRQDTEAVLSATTPLPRQRLENE